MPEPVERDPEHLHSGSSAALLRCALMSADLGTWRVNVKKEKLEWDEKTDRLLGRAGEHVSADWGLVKEYLHPADLSRARDAFNRARSAQQVYFSRFRIIRDDGHIRWVVIHGAITCGSAGYPECLEGTIRDVTPEQQANENEHLLAEIVSESPEAIIVRNMDLEITVWNAGAERIFGYSVEEAIGRDLEFIIPADLRNEQKRLLDRVAKGEHIRRYETRRLCKNGREIDVTLSVSPLRDGSGKIYAIASIEHDISDRVAAERMLQLDNETLERRVEKRTAELQRLNDILALENSKRRRYQQKLRTLREELIRVEERQRRKIATGLHDTVIQNLIYAQISIDQLIGAAHTGELTHSGEALQKLLAETIHELRTMTFALSPPVLYEMGLSPALQWLLEEWEAKHSIHSIFREDDTAKPVSDKVRNMLFQAVKELLANVAKHASATEVRISLNSDNGFMIIRVQDNGQGFNPREQMPDLEDLTGFGLFNMQERIEYFNGKMQIQSKEGRGTLVTLRVPLQIH